MAALNLKANSETGQLILQSALLPRLGTALFSLIWLAVLLIGFVAPLLADNQFDWFAVLIFLFAFVFVGGSLVWSVLTSTTVTLDRTTRTITRTTHLAMFPLRSASLSFNDLAHFQIEYYRQSSGRSAHDAWRLVAAANDLRRIIVNWDGTQNEMLNLGQRVAEFTGVPLVDESAKPASALQKIFDTLRGEPTPANAPPQTVEPVAPAEMEAPPIIDALPTYDTPNVEPATASAPAIDLKSMSIDQLEKRIAADVMDADARYVLARKYHARGQLDPAIKMYQEVLRLDPMNIGAQNDLGVAYQARGKRTEAEAAYRRAAALAPFSFTAHLNLALLLRATNRAAEASQEFYLARQNARGKAETQLAEAASSGGKVEPMLSQA
jgi:tetratricopeptide (TPR) repeat protein